MQDTLQSALTVLHAYYADSPLGPWQPHAKNPLVTDVRGARNAGRAVVTTNGTLLRFAQDHTHAYGHSVVAYRVAQLTPTEYQQVEVTMEVERTAPGTAAWNGVRWHHVDAHQVGAAAHP